MRELAARTGHAVQRRLAAASDRELAATLLAGISVSGPLIGFFTFLFPHPEGTDFVLPSIAFAASIVTGALLWWRRATVGWLPIAVVVAIGALVISAVMLSVPDRTAAYAAYYVWLGVFVFYFLPTSWALAETAWIGVVYAVTIAIDSPPGAVEQWINGVGTTLGVGLFVLALRTRIRGLVRRLESEAATDELTGLPNRRAFDQQLDRELERSVRDEGTISLALLDLDGFKELNDTYGHAAGDEALRELGVVLPDEVRAMDWLARVGGDEFAVILPDAERDEALRVAERLKTAVEGVPVPGISLQASVGIAAGPADGHGPDELLADADRALYAAKRAGGDRVVAADGVA